MNRRQLLAAAISAALAGSASAQVLSAVAGRSVAPPAGGGGGGGGGVPELDSYVSPYDNLNQLYISPTGAGNGSGSSQANAIDFSSLTNFASLSPGDALNFLPGTYDFNAQFGYSADCACDATGPTLAGRTIFRPLPGSMPGSVIIDVAGDANSGVQFINNLSYTTWDGEEVGFVMTGGGGFIDVQSAAPGGGTSLGVEIVNWDASAMTVNYGTSGAANSGAFNLFKSDTASRHSRLENVNIEFAAGSYNINTTSLGSDRHGSAIIRNVEIIHGGRPFYEKHGCLAASSCAEAADRDNFNMIMERTVIERDDGNAWNSWMSWWHLRDVLLLGGFEMDEGGGDGGTANFRIVNFTAPFAFTASDDVYNSNGADGWIIRNSVFGGTHTRQVADSPDMDWIVVPGVTYNGSSNNALAGPNSIIATPTFAGSDRRTITDWELTSGQTDAAGWPLGADISKVGKKSAAAITPNYYANMLTTSLNEASNQTWYDDTTVGLGTHIRHGLGVNTVTWTDGQSGAPSGVGASRHLFTPSTEITHEAEFYVTGTWKNNVHLFHWKTTEEGDFDALGDDNPGSSPGNFTLYLEPRQLTQADGNPCYFMVDLRRNAYSSANPSNRWTEYKNGDGGNLATDSDIDVCDGSTHRVRMFARANDVGSTNGVLKVWVDNVPTILRTDVEYFTIADQAFNQFILAPYLDSTGGGSVGTQTLNVSYIRGFNRDW